MIIDTHCHLDDEKFDADFNEVLSRAKQNGVEKIIIPGASIKDLPKAVKICKENENIFFAVGIHPYHADEMDILLLEDYVKDEKCVAVGECGLDYYRLPDYSVDEYKNTQKAVFSEQIKLAKKTKKPIIIHARDANKDCYDMLKCAQSELVGGVMHCYNASEIFLDLSENFYYGIGGVLTFKNEKKLKEILPKIPLQRLLIETDAPYLAPVPKRGQRNEPAFTSFVCEKMSEILHISKDELEKITTQNAKRLFGI